ncbi:MAG: type II CRISPR-associated endonuclease Cas1 [Alphaproteobacteria bacterium]|nr:type II CRISPR-associated endonuclease Cas1 [Alphaproteobacteria bacterium]
MAWRNLLVQNPAKLSLKNAQLQLENDEGVFSVAVEDLTCIILESHHVTVSTALLARCQEHGVCVVTCDAAHTPNGVLHPFHEHSRQSKVAHLQIGWSMPFKKRCWQSIIRAKVGGQADVLEKYGVGDTAKALRAMRQHVTSGDEKNIEAQAAREYWQKLFGTEFRRHAVDTTNGALNYGYAIMRAAIARSLVGFGLLPAFGLHHDSDLNAFNLADDVIEIFRPFVDNQVKEMQLAGELSEKDLSKENRQKLAGILNTTCMLSGEVHTLINASDKVAERLVVAIEKKAPQEITYPEIQTTLL